MDQKDTNDLDKKTDILLYNNDYLSFIFKKTEKILSAVFYTTRSLPPDLQRDILVHTLETQSLTIKDILERTLIAALPERRALLERFHVALYSLEGTLTLLMSGHLLRGDLFAVFQHELGNVQRALKEYSLNKVKHPLESPFLFEYGRGVKERKRAAVERQTPKSTQGEDGVPLTSRRDRILDIIKNKNHVTIRDIAESVTDVSEKTIQRELMSLITEGVLKKEGERRWSRYSLSTP